MAVHGFTPSQIFSVSSCMGPSQGEPQHCGDTHWCRDIISYEEETENYYDAEIAFDNDSSTQEVSLTVYREKTKNSSPQDWSDYQQMACNKQVNPTVTVDLLADWFYLIVINADDEVPWSGTLTMTPSGS